MSILLLFVGSSMDVCPMFFFSDRDSNIALKLHQSLSETISSFIYSLY
nr:MAG TPA: hypothetical protein [Caudoviricetes sp.]